MSDLALGTIIFEGELNKYDWLMYESCEVGSIDKQEAQQIVEHLTRVFNLNDGFVPLDYVEVGVVEGCDTKTIVVTPT